MAQASRPAETTLRYTPLKLHINQESIYSEKQELCHRFYLQLTLADERREVSRRATLREACF